jgi:aminomethyltransferase
MGAKETALHACHVEAGARLVDFAGYRMPIQYTSMIEEHLLVRHKGGAFDVSHMREFFVEGPAAESCLNRLTVNNVAKLADGQVQYSAMMTPGGGIVDDLLVHRFSADRFMLVVNAANRDKDLAWIQEHAPEGVTVQDRSEEFSLLALQGRDAWQLVVDLAEEDLSGMPYYWFREGTLAGIPLIMARTGYTGERGFELYVKNEDARRLWDAVMPAMRERGMAPVGLGARDTLRLEMKFALYGNDIDESTSTLDADLGWITRLKKGDFLGRDHLLRQKDAGLSRRLVGFEVLDRGIARHDQDCFHDGQAIGRVTSGGHSPMLEKAIGMAYLDLPFDKTGSEFEIDMRGRRVRARVVDTPFVQLEVPAR